VGSTISAALGRRCEPVLQDTERNKTPEYTGQNTQARIHRRIRTRALHATSKTATCDLLPGKSARPWRCTNTPGGQYFGWKEQKAARALALERSLQRWSCRWRANVVDLLQRHRHASAFLLFTRCAVLAAVRVHAFRAGEGLAMGGQLLCFSVQHPQLCGDCIECTGSSSTDKKTEACALCIRVRREGSPTEVPGMHT
jgi:hypothetical protein